MSITSLDESHGIHYQIQQFPWHHYNSQIEQRTFPVRPKTWNGGMGICQQSCCTAMKLSAGDNDGKSRNPSRERIFWGACTNFFKPTYKQHKWTISGRGTKRVEKMMLENQKMKFQSMKVRGMLKLPLLKKMMKNTWTVWQMLQRFLLVLPAGLGQV